MVGPIEARHLITRRVPKVRQHDTTDCGAACLTSIARRDGQRVSIARVRQDSGTDQAGTSILGLARAAERLGYAAKGVRASPESLHRAPMPAVAHVTLAGGMQHFVVLERADARHAWIMDPADGRRYKEARASFDARWSGVLLLLARDAALATVADLQGRTERVWRLVRPHRAVLLAALAGALVYTMLGLAMSIYVRHIVDSVLADGRAGPLHVMTAAMIVVVAAQTILGGMRAALMLRVGQHIDAALILGYYRHLLRLPQSFFDRMRVGELTSRVNDAVKIRAFVAEATVDTVTNVLVVVASMALMFTYDWRLAAWTFGTLPVYGALYAVALRLNGRQQRAMMERAAALESQLVESIGAAGTLKRFALEAHAELQTEARFVRLLRTVRDSELTSLWVGNTGQAVSRLAMIGLLWIGATRALAQQLSVGELMSCYALLGFLTGPALSLLGFSRVVQEARVAGERLFEIMELEAEPAGAPIQIQRDLPGDVAFEGVHFRYGARAATLTDVTFTCARGEITAIVGESGSGKSTVAALLQRLYPLERGRVRIGEQDLAHVELANLRAIVGIVPQNLDLFAGSILENLALGDPAPDMHRLVRLCTDVGLRDTIERMPQGWLTPVGERGAALSGGERQRLAIVRALYRDPAVLIMDEATSALDSANEHLVLETALRAADGGMTVIMIAHRLTTVRAAHHVVVLAAGRVVEEGEHALLSEAGGPYARLWSQQHGLARASRIAGVA